MIWFLIVLAFVFLYNSRFTPFNDGWLAKEQSLAVKGLFIIMVFLSHANPYIGIADGAYSEAWGERLYATVFLHATQLVVVMFLFYSGYGVLKSYLNNPDYQSGFLKKRVLKTLINFDICLIPFVLRSLINGNTYPLRSYILCWIGWEEIGTNSWYICVILLLYLISYLGMKIWSNKDGSALPVLAITCIGSVFLIGFLYVVGKQSWWYNTILCYPLGMFFACYEKEIVKLVKNHWIALLLLFISVGLFLFFHFQNGKIAYVISAVLFGTIIVLISSRLVVGNPVIKWFGEHLFEIFILHRLPLTIFNRIGITNRVLFVFISFASSVALAVATKPILGKIDQAVLRKKG